MSLVLSTEQYTAVLAHARAEWPEEACGLLAGKAGRVCRVYAVDNADHSAATYRMHPAQQVRALMELEAAGLALVGIYHSHPHGPLQPSLTDLDQAAYLGVAHLLLAPDEHGEWRGAAFRLDDGRVCAEPLVVGSDDSCC